MSYKQLQTNFERELLFHLIFNMKQGRMTKDRAQEVARAFLEVLKSEETVAGFMTGLSKRAESFPEMQPAFIKTAREFEKENVDESLNNVRFELNKLYE